MDNGIGATLRETRNRRKLDLSEVEAAIKIRVRFLRAMENEEWDALPGDAYTRGFIRTYADYLGLDGERLAEDFRHEAGAPGAGQRAPKRVEPVPAAFKDRKPRVPARLVLILVSLGLLGLLIGIGLAGDDGDNGDSAPGAPAATEREEAAQGRQQATAPAPDPRVAVSLAATAEVWVCLLDAAEEPLIEGEILAEGADAGPFRSRGFELAFGNGSVELSIDGEPAQIEESSGPVGYEINSDGELLALEEGERPDCE